VYHLELRQFPHVTRAFNLSREELDRRFLMPWAGGSVIDHDDRKWSPERAKLTIFEGRELRPEEIGLGRGWANVIKHSEDVTDAVVAEAQRGAQARPEVEALKATIDELAGRPITFTDVIALAAAAHPHWRASEQLAIAEQGVWEMLHQSRLTMIAADEPVPRDRWQSIVLSWATWTGDGPDQPLLHIGGASA
jgi:hypothetical protein